MFLPTLYCVALLALADITLLFAKYVRSTNDVFIKAPGTLDLCPNQRLILIWKHNVPDSNIKACHWDVNLTGEDDWKRVIIYDNNLKKITEKNMNFDVIDDARPCKNGIWNPTLNNSPVTGRYKMTVIKQDGNTAIGPIAQVGKANVSCPVCSPCVLNTPPTEPTKASCPTCPPSDVNTPQAEPTTECRYRGYIAGIVLLFILLVCAVVAVCLVYKDILPQQWRKKKSGNPNQKSEEQISLQPNTDHQTGEDEFDNQDTEGEELRERDNKINELNKQLGESNTAVNGLKSKLEDTVKTVEQLKGELQERDKEVDEVNKQLQDRRQNVDELNSKLQVKSTKLDEVTRERNELTTQLQIQKENNEQLLKIIDMNNKQNRDDSPSDPASRRFEEYLLTQAQDNRQQIKESEQRLRSEMDRQREELRNMLKDKDDVIKNKEQECKQATERLIQEMRNQYEKKLSELQAECVQHMKQPNEKQISVNIASDWVPNLRKSNTFLPEQEEAHAGADLKETNILQEEILNLKTELQTTKIENDKLKEDLKACTTKNTRLKDKLEEVEDLNRKLNIDLQKCNTDRKGFEGELQKCKTKKKVLEAELEKCKTDKGDLEDKLQKGLAHVKDLEVKHQDGQAEKKDSKTELEQDTKKPGMRVHDERDKIQSLATRNGADSSWRDIFAEQLKGDMELDAGNDLVLSVKVQKEDTVVKWYKDDVNLNHNPPNVDITTDNQKISLILDHTKMDVPGVYRCEGTRGDIVRTMETKVKVANAPGPTN